MNVENIGYLYKREELKALTLILGLDGLPGVSLPELDEPAYRAALASLAESGIVAPSGASTGVERLTTLLLANAAHCRRGFRIESAAKSVLIWRGSSMYLLGSFPDSGECALIPLQTLADVRAALPPQVRPSGALPFSLYDVAAPEAPLRRVETAGEAEDALNWVCGTFESAEA